MSIQSKIIVTFLFGFFILSNFSCAPVKFSKADEVVVTQSCEGTGCETSSIKCDPKINDNQITFTYASGVALPSITSKCSPADVDYKWNIKKADASEVTATIPGLSGKNPAQVDFTSLGQGAYYVYLTATKTGSGLNAYTAITPLEFVVPGSTMGNSLTCDPKLNSTLTSVVLNQNDNNPVVTANCNPAAATYTWSVTKDGVAITIAGLSGASSTPDIKSYGVGTYRLSLYATAVGSQHWQTTTPLTVTVNQTTTNMTPIQCNPKINGSLDTLTLTASSANPLISANCLPSDITYTWSVTKNGATVALPTLVGANSNPNFSSLGNGTYLVYLAATANNYKTWNTTTPLIITVESASNMTLSCSARLNGSATSVTITPTGSNPTVTSGCTPVAGTQTWTVFKNGQPVTIANLSGASSTPNFTAAGLGTYFIYLTATASGYNAYVSPAPLEVTVAEVVNPYREVTYEKLVEVSQNKVDLLVVLDDSNSMAPDNAKLAQKLQGFVSGLTSSGIDWQICATVTRSQDVNGNGTYYWGASKNWVNYVGSPAWILKMGAADPYSIFTNTISAIGAGWAGTDDERGLKAAWWSMEYGPYNNCYRKDASISVILISDEDERSVGGDASKVYYNGELKPLEADDQPEGLLTKVRQTFGLDKRFTFNSIIVKPGDAACMSSQDSEGAKSHYGYKYNEMSQLTNGAVGSICANDYSSNLYYFKDRIINSLASIPLECTPVGDISVVVTPTTGSVNATVENNMLVFNPVIPVGRTVNVKYKCPRQ